MQESPAVFLIGAGGLLGSAIRRKCEADGVEVFTIHVDWQDADAATLAFREGAIAFSRWAGKSPWRIIWCAGSGTTTTSEENLAKELEILQTALAQIAAAYADSPSTALTVFFASSAGAIYAGSLDPPYTENTTATPISAYGKVKLLSEEALAAFAERVNGHLLIGRIANLYGPGQNMRKSQGLISILAGAAITGKPAKIYVPMDTARDYIFVDDCAEMILKCLDTLKTQGTQQADVTLKIFASGESITLQDLISTMRASINSDIPIITIESPVAAFQARTSTFNSVVMPDVRATTKTSLSQGIRITYDSVKGALDRS